jgi:hypothetical protein
MTAKKALRLLERPQRIAGKDLLDWAAVNGLLVFEIAAIG